VTVNRLARIVLTIICAGIFAMWVYAFGFASRESFNRIEDDAWKARSEARCLVAENERFALQDLGKMNVKDTAALRKKADIVAIATDSLERAINDISRDMPSDAKGKELVPQWISDYRIYIQNRRQFIEKLRTAPTRPFFSETEVEGVPISERLGKFARENDMKTCQPPLDLSV
jgi:hypothetical protein